jgi:hypothetical protein
MLYWTNKLCELQKKHGVFECVADCANPANIQAIENAGFTCYPCVKGAGSIDSGVTKVKARLIGTDGRPSLYYYGSAPDKPTEQTIDSGVPYTIPMEVNSWCYNAKKDGFEDKNNHLLDALRYGVNHLDEDGECVMLVTPKQKLFIDNNDDEYDNLAILKKLFPQE